MSEDHKELSEVNQKLSIVNEELAKEIAHKQKQKTNLIQFGTTVGTALTLTAISWLVSSTHANSEKLGRIDERINAIAQDRYTGTDATKDLRILNTRIDGLEVRLNRHANRVERLEQTLIDNSMSRANKDQD